MPKCLKQYLFKYSDNFVFDDNLIELSGANLQLHATSSVYPISNPSVITKKSIPLIAINSFVPTVVTPTGSDIKYTLIKDGQDFYYHSGWVVSDGSYSQANSLAEIQANIATFTTSRVRVKIRIFLSSTTGAATPAISSLNFGFDYTGYSTPDDVRALMGNKGLANIDDEDLLGAIEIADSQIDSYLGNYSLPLTTVPAQIRGYSAVIASYNLYSSYEVAENGATKSPQRVRYEQAIRELQDISTSKKAIAELTATDKSLCYSTSESIVEENEISIMFDNFSS